MQPKSIDQVVKSGLCSGCGACAYLQPKDIQMVDVVDQGRRPQSLHGKGMITGEAMAACPGIGLSRDLDGDASGQVEELSAGWGPVYRLWEGFAADHELRYGGSSGGAASALALFALEGRGFEGVLHTGANSEKPYLNQTVISRSREELLARTGSRYSPASPCDRLGVIEEAKSPFVFIGKPCDVAAANAARRIRPSLDKALGLTIAFFCAGTPSTAGTLEMLKRMGVTNPESIRELRFRGNGWPGRATVGLIDADAERHVSSLSYEESWGEILTKHVQWRCRLCADHTGEFADIAVGDPWYRPVRDGEPGSSLILARSKAGLEFIEGAIRSGYLIAKEVTPDLLPRSQPNLLKARGAVWGRTVALASIAAAAPRYVGFATFRFWLSELNAIDKIKSIVGTVRRCLGRGLHPWTRDW
jgi:coenzyme F420 hydrogenase subunit beta